MSSLSGCRYSVTGTGSDVLDLQAKWIHQAVT